MMVQPKSRFTRKMAVASGLSRAMIVGRKYSRTEKIRNNIMQTPSAGIRLKGKQKEPLAKAKYAGKPRFVRSLAAIEIGRASCRERVDGCVDELSVQNSIGTV